MTQKHYISVILPLKLEWEPSYWTHEDIGIGARVKVMLSGKAYTGVVSGVGIEPDIDRKRIREVVSIERDIENILPEEIALWRRVAEYYLCSVGEVYKAAYPAGKINMEEMRAAAKRKVMERRQRIIDSIDSKIEKLQLRLVNKQIQETKAREGTKAKSKCLADINNINVELRKAMEAKEAATEHLLAAQEGEVTFCSQLKESSITLSEAQQRAFTEIQKGFSSGRPVLLHGVTGAGKTEIYIKAAWEALKSGKNVLYLVPEIALSRQLEERLHEHFGERLLTFHSGESAASKRNSAETIRNLHVKNGNYVALGTRSSLFLPHHALGLIIVDEEHDSSYKQESPAPRYNGRDTALMLSRIHNGCNIILGSATPSLEEIYNTQVGRHALVELKERYHGSHDSEIEIIDTKAERRKRGMHGNFSRKLIDHINRTLKNGEQVLILRSRRAWSAVLQCEDCGEIQKCPHCNVGLSFHKNTGKMACHYCGYSCLYDGRCSKCGGSLTNLGAGTQKIEEEATGLFPQARIARLDSDTAQNKTYETKTIKDFAKGEIDILIGTQIITKGFDFSNLSLVAIIAADSLLGIQDFRADEKALHLMEQFRGRCGRRSGRGLFVIQTSQPEHPIYQQIANNQTLCISNLMLERKDFNFPPYSRIIELTIKDRFEDRADRMSRKLAEKLHKHLPCDTNGLTCGITGPYSPVIDRIAEVYLRKIRLCLRKDRNLSSNKARLQRLISEFELENRYDSHIIIDVDPS